MHELEVLLSRLEMEHLSYRVENRLERQRSHYGGTRYDTRQTTHTTQEIIVAARSGSVTIRPAACSTQNALYKTCKQFDGRNGALSTKVIYRVNAEWKSELGYATFYGPGSIRLRFVLNTREQEKRWWGVAVVARLNELVDEATATIINKKGLQHTQFHWSDSARYRQYIWGLHKGSLRFRVADELTLKSGDRATLSDNIMGNSTALAEFDYTSLPSGLTCKGTAGTEPVYELRKGATVVCESSRKEKRGGGWGTAETICSIEVTNTVLVAHNNGLFHGGGGQNAKLRAQAVKPVSHVSDTGN